MVIKIFPEVNSTLIDATMETEFYSMYQQPDSIGDACQFQHNASSSPFASRKVMYENEEVNDTINTIKLTQSTTFCYRMYLVYFGKTYFLCNSDE